ncbi:hypothetical protein PBAL39_00470 [Pedobacter sp. BAL39]|nr:hypothetical protein PBAL39_00470 [Pedobacter sp. BAL39]
MEIIFELLFALATGNWKKASRLRWNRNLSK